MSLQWLGSLLWLGFDLWPGNCHLQQAKQKKKKKKKVIEEEASRGDVRENHPTERENKQTREVHSVPRGGEEFKMRLVIQLHGYRCKVRRGI